jgi:CubicO group peptidase (beta-lactamase class C family)
LQPLDWQSPHGAIAARSCASVSPRRCSPARARTGRSAISPKFSPPSKSLLPQHRSPFPEAAYQDLPETFDYEGQAWDTDAFLEDTDTAAMLVLKDGEIIHETYAGAGGRTQDWLSWSVAKSFVSALVGIAIEEGHIHSIYDPVTDHVPALKGSAYDGVTIKQVLQMCSGASWNEDYSDWKSDINRFARTFRAWRLADRFRPFAGPSAQARHVPALQFHRHAGAWHAGRSLHR